MAASRGLQDLMYNKRYEHKLQSGVIITHRWLWTMYFNDAIRDDLFKPLIVHFIKSYGYEYLCITFKLMATDVSGKFLIKLLSWKKTIEFISVDWAFNICMNFCYT